MCSTGPSRVDVALPHEDQIVVHPVHLDRETVRPGPELAYRHTRVEKEASPGAGAGLAQLLGGQLVRRPGTAVDELIEADLFGVRHSYPVASPAL